MPVPLWTLVRTREQDGVTAVGGVQGQLVQREGLVSSLEDAAPSGAAHTKYTHLQFGHLLDMHICSYSPYSGTSLLATKLHLLHHPRKGWRRPLGATHEQPLQLLDGGVGSSGQEPVQLHQQP